MNINEHLVLGKINRLVVDRSTVPGLFLMAEDGKDVLLPNQYVTDEMNIGDELDVFLYTDSEDRLVATTQRALRISVVPDPDPISTRDSMATSFWSPATRWNVMTRSIC